MRRKAAQVGVLAIVMDDISTDELTTLPLSTYKTETSPNNHQVGFAVTGDSGVDAAGRPYEDRSLKKGLAKPDGSGNNVVRYVRLPFGRNTKARVIADHGEPFVCRLVEINPHRRYTLEEIAQAFDIDLAVVRTSDPASSATDVGSSPGHPVG